MSKTPSFKTTIDVRSIAPRERHPLIFGSFDELAAGEALLLINDHDPKPLFYQFQAESKEKFTWDYLESGPEVWQVKIGKPDTTATPTTARSSSN
ncbi:Hemerythrin [Georgfuchsia toluolica]|uniref:Hemerythrin n=1 Tax=Georgfuchsia toluolica TaxID=424218 RepID=A0A916MZX8_9PROT|nr:DUF2249 domain-containing protein [Georgfuchsia toluolica]CAG4883358.1 Hemerythrin [Georgfuchsia toluolica]